MTPEPKAKCATIDDSYWKVRGAGSGAFAGSMHLQSNDLKAREISTLPATGGRQLEMQIDRVEYGLYGLGEEEILIVEGGIK